MNRKGFMVRRPRDRQTQRGEGSIRSHAAGRSRVGLILLIGLTLGAGTLLTGCDDCYDDCGDPRDPYRPDYSAPLTPFDLWSVTGDREVLLLWSPNSEEDLAGYRIYRSTESSGYYPRIASVGASAASFVDRDVRNGVTYYYTIAAYDFSGNESELFAPSIHDTPRPEGGGLRLRNARIESRDTGYDF